MLSAMAHTTEITPILSITFIYWAHHTLPFETSFELLASLF